MRPVHGKAVTIQLSGKDPVEFTGDLQVYLVVEEKDGLTINAAPVVQKVLQQAWATGDFKGKKEQVLLFYPALMEQDQTAKIEAKRVLLAGLGKKEEEINVRREQLRIAGGAIAKQAGSIKAKEVLVVLPKEFSLEAAEIAECLTQGLLLGNYRFELHKTPKETDDQPGRVERFFLHAGGLASGAVRKGMQKGQIVAEAACAARDMANQPGNHWTPYQFVEYAKNLCKKTSLKCKALDKPTMQKLGMGGILGVNQGSALPAQLVIVEYKTEKSNPTILLVGKGLTFDSGGICLKPPAGMEDMKYDMCGGAAVLATMQAIAESEISGINVVALIPATENLTGSAALKPGDVIRHYGGKTSEIINTDAEGRLILADALAYGIDTYKPEAVIDIATLTGAVIIGLGHHNTGLMSNNDQLAARLLAAGAREGEPMWRLPLGAEYRKQIDSRVADIKNAGSDRSAGSITAACYLQEFVGDTPWAHLDIAGTAWDFTEKSYIPKGPSGTGVRTLVACLRQWDAWEDNGKKQS